MPFRIDCGFRNRLLLGLAIWFSKTEPLVAAATSCYRASTSRLHPFQLRGCTLYFEAISLSSGRCCLPSSLHLAGNPHRAVALCCFLSRGAESTSHPRLLSTRFVDSFFHLAAAFAVSRGGGFYHHRVESQLRSSTSYFVFHCISRRSPSPVRLRLSVRGGAASIAPPWVASTAHFSRLIPLAVRFFQPYWRGPQDL